MLIIEAGLFFLAASGIVKGARKVAGRKAAPPREASSGRRDAQKVLGGGFKALGAALGDTARSSRSPKPRAVKAGAKNRAKTTTPAKKAARPTKGWAKPVRERKPGDGVSYTEILDGVADLVRWEGRRPWGGPKKRRWWRTEKRTFKEGLDAAKARQKETRDAERKPTGTGGSETPPAAPAASVPRPRTEAKPKPIRVSATRLDQPQEGQCVYCRSNGAPMRDKDSTPRRVCDHCYVTGPSPVLRTTGGIVPTPAFFGVYESGDGIAGHNFASVFEVLDWLRAVAEGTGQCAPQYEELARRLREEMKIDESSVVFVGYAATNQQHAANHLTEAANALDGVLDRSTEDLLDAGEAVPHEDLITSARGGAPTAPEFYAKLAVAVSIDFHKDPRRVLELLYALRDGSEQQGRTYDSIYKFLQDATEMRMPATVWEQVQSAAREQEAVTRNLGEAASKLIEILRMKLRELADSNVQAPVAQPS